MNEKMNLTALARDDKGLLFFGNSMIVNMKVCYERLLLEGAPQELAFDNLLQAVRQADDINIEAPLEILKRVLFSDKLFSDDQIAKAPLGPVILCAIFAFRAHKEWEVDRRVERAWSYMADACFWCGVARTGSSMDASVMKERSQKASKAAKAKNMANNELRDYAWALARQKRLQQEKWKSRASAAKSLLPKINAYANSKTMKMVGESTVTEWMYQMDDAEELFKPHHRTKARPSRAA